MFVLVAMLLTTIGKVDAKADTKYLQRINPTGKFDIHVAPGEYRHFVIPVKYADGTFWVNSLRATSDNDSIQVSNVKITNPKRADEPGYECESVVDRSEVYNLEFDVTSASDLKIGYNTITVSGNIDIARNDNENLPDVVLITLTTYTAKELKPIEISLDKVVYDEKDVYPGNNFTMKLKLKNTGEVQAINTFLNMSFGNSGIVPNYTIENISVGVINPGDTKTIEVPVTVTKSAVPGFYDITANITCKDVDGKDAGPFNRNIYITVIKPDANAIKNTDPVLSLSTSDNFIVLKPDTDDSLSVTVKNIGEATATDVRLNILSGLNSSNGLTKAFTDEYIEIGEIKAGKEKTVEVPIHVSSALTSELQEIKMSASYKDT